MQRMLEALLPDWVTRVVVFLEPINTGWGTEKLGKLCREVMGVEPDHSTCYLFANRKQDTLVMYLRCHDGDQTLMKRLEKGAFLLPASEEGRKPYVVLRPAMLARLFRA